MKRNDFQNQRRGMQTTFHIRSKEENSPDDEKCIEGYFALYENETELWEGCREIISKGAFSNTITKNDVRALINHDTTLVLGRTKAGTLELKEDDKGLFGRIRINPNDSDAMNLYSRVERGDVDQCSFGFNIIDEDYEELADGSVRFRINEIDLQEVSCCTFPAYEDTSIQARKKDFEKAKGEIQERSFDAQKNKLKKRLEDLKNA
ncbi:MAG: HK97 family phage prohead protease [Clostridia bacterium]|nr:HK97 family phage prohead protease [Clostridia bacterium]